ncbi:MAG TPA: acetyltransferase [Negativicutes bacterium]|nr:acetyltransferase [Negativicutes bacterium]
MQHPVIVLGAGGHAKVLVDTLQRLSADIVALVDVAHGGPHAVLGVPVVSGEETVLRYNPEEIRLVNGIGSVGSTRKRAGVFQRFHDQGYHFATVVHPAAVVAGEVTLAEGVQIMAGAVVQPGCTIGADTIVNTGATIDHDCRIGAHVHIAPGATLSGGVVADDGVHIGAGATVIQGVRLGADSIVGAGAAVLKDVAVAATVVGVPAKEAHS